MKNYRVVNLELTLPAVRDMPERITREVRQARQTLTRASQAGQIACCIPGEKLSIFDADTQRALRLCDELRRDPDLDRHNNGVTIVVL